MRVDAPRFRTALVEAVSAAHRSRRQLCVWWVDVDDCSALNDRFGEPGVDEALKRFEQQLLGEPVAFFARMEGACWAVALEGLDEEEGRTRADALRARQLEGAEPRLSLSVGVACRRAGEPALNLLEAAELACTRAKQGGRGCVVGR